MSELAPAAEPLPKNDAVIASSIVNSPGSDQSMDLDAELELSADAAAFDNGPPAAADDVVTAVGHYADDEAIEDPAATRRALIDQLIDIGFEDALGDGDPKQTKQLRETIPAELMQQIVASGNNDLLALFVGVAGWGVEGVDLDDPAGNDWRQLRQGKSLTDHTQGGFGIAHYDSESLEDIVGTLRETDVHEWAENQGYEPSGDEDLRAPQERLQGEGGGKILFKQVRNDPAWQEWASAAVSDRDMQRFLIESWAHKWKDAEARAKEDAQELGVDPYELAFYYAGARNSRNTKMNTLANKMLEGDNGSSPERILETALLTHGDVEHDEEGWHVDEGGTFDSPSELMRSSNGASKNHDASRIVNAVRAKELHAYFNRPALPGGASLGSSPLHFDDAELDWQIAAIADEQSTPPPTETDVDIELAHQNDEITKEESTTEVDVGDPQELAEPSQASVVPTAAPSDTAATATEVDPVESVVPLDSAAYEQALADNVMVAKLSAELVELGMPGAEDALEALLDERMTLVQRHELSLEGAERDAFAREHVPLRRRAKRNELDALSARYAELSAANGGGKPSAEMKALREQRRLLSNEVNASMTEWDQDDPEWAYEPYGRGAKTDMRANGCMPVSIAMAANFHLQELPVNLADGEYDDEFRPYDDELAERWTRGKGRSHVEGSMSGLDASRSGAHFVRRYRGEKSIISHIGEALPELTGEKIKRDEIEEQLLDGNPVVATVPSKNGAHVVVITGIDETGRYILSDPGYAEEPIAPSVVKSSHAITPTESTP